MTLDEAIQIVDHDPQWSEDYRSDASEIEVALAAWSPALEHFGSTSVPGLAAKPIIDVLVGLEHWPMVEGVPNALRPLGYEHLGEAGVPGREYFRRRRLHDTNIAVVESRLRGQSRGDDNSVGECQTMECRITTGFSGRSYGVMCAPQARSGPGQC